MSGRSRERATLESRSQSGFGVRGGDRGEQAVLRTVDNTPIQAGSGGSEEPYELPPEHR